MQQAGQTDMQSVEEISTRRRLYDDGGWPYCVVCEVVCCVLAGTRASERGEAAERSAQTKRTQTESTAAAAAAAAAAAERPSLRPSPGRSHRPTDRPTAAAPASPSPTLTIDCFVFGARRVAIGILSWPGVRAGGDVARRSRVPPPCPRLDRRRRRRQIV